MLVFTNYTGAYTITSKKKFITCQFTRLVKEMQYTWASLQNRVLIEVAGGIPFVLQPEVADKSYLS